MSKGLGSVRLGMQMFMEECRFTSRFNTASRIRVSFWKEGKRRKDRGREIRNENKGKERKREKKEEEKGRKVRRKKKRKERQ